jgi:hypothetical protein
VAEKLDALEALRDILKTAVNSDQLPTSVNRAYVYHTQYSSVNPDPPFLIVGKVDGIENQRGVHTHGVSYDRWLAFAILYLDYGNPEHPSEEGAAAVKLEEGWPKAFSDVLLDNLTLSDTVVKIGDPDGNRLKVFDYQSDYYQWNAEPYWGIQFAIPIMQYVEQGTSV